MNASVIRITILAVAALAPFTFAARGGEGGRLSGFSVRNRLKGFPIAVWLQDPDRAAQCKAAGINLYVGLWKGPTEAQLEALAAAGMPVICHQNEVGLRSKNNSGILAWMHGDEPDNAQAKAGGGYGPPIPPAKIVEGYRRIRARDPSRPVFLNLGRGVAWDNWRGRGVRTNHPEDYTGYVKGCDIVSFDIYPVAHGSREVHGNLWYVARGVERLVKWSEGRKVVWNCIECTRISADCKATPQQVKAEVWMAIIHGSTGLVYFVHEWKPRFNEHALLDDQVMLAGVTAINRQIQELAPALAGPDVEKGATVRSSNGDVPVAVMTKEHGDATYVFSVAMREGNTTARFTVPGTAPPGAEVEVIGEDRKLALRSGGFEDRFGPYQVHLYRIGKPPKAEPPKPVERKRRPAKPVLKRTRPTEAKPPAVDPAVAKLYQDAETAFIDGDVDNAKAPFEKIIRDHPESEYAVKAREYLDIIE